jgi:hypothetical protein
MSYGALEFAHKAELRGISVAQLIEHVSKFLLIPHKGILTQKYCFVGLEARLGIGVLSDVRYLWSVVPDYSRSSQSRCPPWHIQNFAACATARLYAIVP